jgi:hypothetical protein
MQNNCGLHWPLEVDTWEAGGDRKTIAQNTILSLYYTMWNSFSLQKYRNGGQLWVVNVFSYTIHAQTHCWKSRSPLALSIFFSLLLWRFLSSQLFCVYYNLSSYRSGISLTLVCCYFYYIMLLLSRQNMSSICSLVFYVCQENYVLTTVVCFPTVCHRTDLKALHRVVMMVFVVRCRRSIST